MSAGEFDRRVTLQSPAQVQNAYGEAVPTWTTVATVWAKRLGAKGRETYAAGHDLALVDEVFQIRYSATVSPCTAKWRLLFNSKTYNIASAVEVGRRELIAITCTTGENNG